MVTRRQLVQGAILLPALAIRVPAAASPAEEAAIDALTKGASVKRGRVTLSMPAIAENGLSVYTTIAVESPMTEDDYVKAVHLFSEKNPVPRVATFYFTPALAEAKVATNIRLAASQRVTAIAVMSDGSLWSDEKEIVVSVAACIDGG